MNLKTYVAVLLWGVVLLSHGMAPAVPGDSRPNFLIVMVDDISPDQFGCYGNREVETPHIDALARGGVQFNTAWATPMCSPTRALLVTGRYPSRTGVWHNDLRLDCTAEDRWSWAQRHLTFAQVLRGHGYRTALVGNPMALGSSFYSDDVGFDEHCIRALTLADVPAGATFTGQFEGAYNFPNAKPVPSRYWHPCVIRNGALMETMESDFGPDLYTAFLADFMKRDSDQPFLAYYPMNLVHDMAGGGIPTTPVRGVPGSNKGGNLEDLIEYIDRLVGRLISSLDEAGLRENTVVIFTADNGSSHGRKMHANEYGPHVPFIVNGPGLIKRRGKTSVLMEFSDIFSTLMDFSGSILPEGYEVDGQSMVPFLTGKRDTHRTSITSWIATARMARTQQWILEDVDPVYGSEEGRISFCGDAYNRMEYVDMSESDREEVQVARDELERALERNPWPDRTMPAVADEVEAYNSMPYKHFVEGVLVSERGSSSR
jgi:arylsulfatase A-like enzyme